MALYLDPSPGYQTRLPWAPCGPRAPLYWLPSTSDFWPLCLLNAINAFTKVLYLQPCLLTRRVLGTVLTPQSTKMC